MNRTVLSVGAVAVALAAVTGVAALTAPEEPAHSARSVGTAARKPVERSTLVCPSPSTSDVAETAYEAFTPKGGPGKKGSAALYAAERADPQDPEDPADGKDGDTSDSEESDKDKDKNKNSEKKKEKSEDGAEGGHGAEKGNGKPFLSLGSPGTPVEAETDDSEAPALTGTADGPFAPGWTVQQTTTVAAGAGRGLQGTSCSVPDTSFWFPGAGTAEGRQDYVHLTNPDSTPAVVDLELYGKEGKEKAGQGSGEGITVPPHATVPVLLSTLTSEPVTNVTLHVIARSGRVGAQIQSSDRKLGGDWLPPAADPAPGQVLPGIPEDATAVRLSVLAPGGADADLKVQLAGKSGRISPAGHESLHVKAGMVTTVDLKGLIKGESGSLVLSPAEDGDDAPDVVAAARVLRGKGSKQETAFVPATAPVQKRATAAGNTASGTTLALAAPEGGAKVRVTASPGSGGGSSKSTTVTLKAHTTKAFTPPRPADGKGGYAVTVERLSGGPVYASRTLESEQSGVPGFTVQTLPDDRSTVAVPESAQDLAVLNDDE
ncbi:DUF5719 family protein [Streptomyces qinglanensis]|uniref:Secreted protein n=1 Tax=Streptomyces qinglanensis TaxID=943816 RepID=A0A1H9VHT6_9ACTN|nr:DUF5719 family protein [Streptomyces qinglanensis]SES21232.1 hypothetical protein SAMN05421870_11214 [Streptomyces qinglanensis]